MIRLLLFAVLVYFLLRLVRRVVSMLALKTSPPRASQNSESRHSSGVIDEMKPCPTCGTYNPTRLAYRKKDLYFCNERCHESFILRERSS